MKSTRQSLTGYFFACSQNKFVDEAMKSTRQS